MTPNESQQPISKPCLGDCSVFKMKQQGQSVFELQIQVKRDSLLQTIWLGGLCSRCTLTGPHTLTFYFNVHSVQMWAESESQRKQPTVLSCSILRGNLSLCLYVRTRACRLLMAFNMRRENPSFLVQTIVTFHWVWSVASETRLAVDSDMFCTRGRRESVCCCCCWFYCLRPVLSLQLNLPYL